MRLGTKHEAKADGGRRTVTPGGARNGPADVGANLRRIRNAQGHSLESLAGLSGVSRAMLGQIETGKSTPTVTLIWKVANALSVPVSALIEGPKSSRVVLLPKASARLIATNGGGFTLRAFAAPGVDQRAALYEMNVAPGHRESIDAYAGGTRASLVVAAGELDITVEDGASFHLEAGDGILFEADSAHEFYNSGSLEATAYLVLAPARNGANTFHP